MRKRNDAGFGVASTSINIRALPAVAALDLESRDPDSKAISKMFLYVA
jgi:hypothetical protein